MLCIHFPRMNILVTVFNITYLNTQLSSQMNFINHNNTEIKELGVSKTEYNTNVTAVERQILLVTLFQVWHLSTIRCILVNTEKIYVYAYA